jgi:CRISPR-associated endonuclease/helicase Cas3
MKSYSDFFEQATGYRPYPYQQVLANGAPTVLDVYTGLGKTEATTLAWLYRRLSDPDNTPRRLFYCLPMRALVEQMRSRIAESFARLEQLKIQTPRIEVVMGGDIGEEWFLVPERPCVVIGTQDMLLSRALNRGYGMSRFQWPMTFGAANDDAYWVIDEVQLQGIGAVTSTQLHAFRERLGTFHRTEITLASATIDVSWFETGDFTMKDRLRVSLSGEDLADPSVRAVISAKKQIRRVAAYEPRDIAEFVRGRHRAGTRTLVIVNRVARAQEVYRHLRRSGSGAELALLHSRFRPDDRAAHAEELLADVDPSGPGRVVVATQVVEAGVDVSATTLITDVAPWPSLVQRFGRCNRRGKDTDATCFWLDPGEVKKTEAQPYELEDLVAACELLSRLEGASAAPVDLPKRSIPLRTGLVIRKPEFLDLFDTSPDLSGHDVDVSPYIRDADDVAVSLFWRDEPPSAEDVPQRAELCTAPVSSVRELLKSLRATGHGAEIRVENQFARDADNAWTELHEGELRPGIMIWLRSDVGWYDSEFGFGKVQRYVLPIRRQSAPGVSENCPVTDSDLLSQIGVAVTLTEHAQDTARHARDLAGAIGLPEPASTMVTTAALWHDTGKTHEVFQDTMRRANERGPEDGATIWAKGMHRAQHRRRGFRHELPGALAYLHAHDGESTADAVAYLIAAHHGKLRVAAQQLPYEAACVPFQFLGTREGETLSAVDLGGGVQTLPCTLSLDQFRIGSKDGKCNWVDRTIALRDDPSIGPFRLAYLELVVRLADWRASKEEMQCR